jgi:plastocyanin
MTRLGLLCLMAAACGGGSSKSADAPAAAKVVTCPAAPDATITTNSLGTAYTPDTATISVNGTVHFMLPSIHNASSTAFSVPFGGDECLQFVAAGTYSFMCTAHGFTGTITVQ